MDQELRFHAQHERNDIREEEKFELVQRNPNIHFETPSIVFGVGRQSRVSALEIIKDQTTTRVIWKRCGVEKGLTKDETIALCERLLPYRTTLQEYGWNVPEILYSEPVTTQQEEVIFSYEQLISAIDAERMFKDPQTAHFERLSVLQKSLSILTNDRHNNLTKKAYFGHAFSQLPYGIDLKLANLILDQRGKLYFVDFFGPKELNKDGTWRSYTSKLDSLPKENLMTVCATREGCILRLLKLSLKNLPDQKDIHTYTQHFSDIVTLSDLPQEEKTYILSELEKDFPMLDRVYEEYKV